MDGKMGVEMDVLASQAYTRSADNGFWEQFPSRFVDERSWIGEKIGLAHTELSEALQASRRIEQDFHRYEAILGELGDTIWRCLDMAYVIHQFDGLRPGRTLGALMVEQADKMPERGRLHGKRW